MNKKHLQELQDGVNHHLTSFLSTTEKSPEPAEDTGWDTIQIKNEISDRI